MGPETPDYIPEDDPQSSEEILEYNQSNEIFESAEVIRLALEINDTPENWMALLEDISTPPINPEDNERNAYLQSELVKRYNDLDTDLAAIGNGFYFIINNVDSDINIKYRICRINY